MRLQQLRIRNFGSVEEAEVPLDEQGLVLLEGENLDAGGSNGAGKTTLIPDAISWCLFGVTTKGLKSDDVVRVSSTPHGGTEVQLSFELNGQDVTVARYRQHATAGNKIMLIVDGDDRTPATAKLTEEAIVGLLGTTEQVWRYAVVLGQGLAFRFSQLTDAERERLLEDIVRAQVYDEARERATARARALSTQIASAEGMIAAREQQLAADREGLKQAGLRVQSESAEWEVRKTRLEQAIAQFSKEVEQGRAGQEAAQRALAEFDRGQAESQRQLDAAIRDTATIEGQRRTRESQLAAWRAQQVTWDSKAECPTCQQPITAEFRQTFKDLWATEIATQEQVVAALAAQVSAAKDAEARLRQAQTRRMEQRQGLVAAVQRADAPVRAAEQNLRLTQQELNVGGTFPSAALLEHLSKAVTRAEGEIKGMVGELDDQKSVLALVQFWVTGFADIRRARISEMVRLVNQRLAYYLSEVSGKALGAEILVSEKNTASGVATKFTLAIRGPGGSYRSASGGEKDRVDVAIAFALHDLVMASTGFTVNVLVADELCPAVDLPGIQSVVTALRAKLATVGSIFVMAHHDGWKRLTDTVWTVQKAGGVTRLIRKGSALAEPAVA